jgi:hypothetical protein
VAVEMTVRELDAGATLSSAMKRTSSSLPLSGSGARGRTCVPRLKWRSRCGRIASRTSGAIGVVAL